MYLWASKKCFMPTGCHVCAFMRTLLLEDCLPLEWASGLGHVTIGVGCLMNQDFALRDVNLCPQGESKIERVARDVN